MRSQIESIRSTQYTPLYENEQFESRISQWRLFKAVDFLNTICMAEKNYVVTKLDESSLGPAHVARFWSIIKKIFKKCLSYKIFKKVVTLLLSSDVDLTTK